MSNFEVPSPIRRSPSEELKEHGWILEGQRGEHGQSAVEVIDPRGGELLAGKKVEEGK